MSEKRRDNRNRILHTGESQRPDGRYFYKYADIDGTAAYVYSWRLDKNDRTPAGKKHEPSLREKEAEIQKKLFVGLSPSDGNMTVLELVEKYLSSKNVKKHNTTTHYQYVLNVLRKEAFSRRKISTVLPSDAKAWLVKMQTKDGRGYSTIHSVRGVVRPAFQMAVEDNILLRNPFDFQLHTVCVNDAVRRDALTRDQERKFLAFVKTEKHFRRYYEGIYVLFHTGLRISEFCGLTVSDIDFENNCIHIERQLQRTRKMNYVIEETKTTAGTRVLPMTPDVREAFERILQDRPVPKFEPEVDGISGFLYLDKNENPNVALHWEHYFKRLVEKYNSIYRKQLPPITPHVCRHTYCSIMAKDGMNPKTLQYLMGHADISVTMNTYTHVKYEDAVRETAKIASQKGQL